MLEYKVAVVGLGYVGLPLAVESGKKHHTLGFDINTKRINELNKGIDHTLEIEKNDISDSIHLSFSNDEQILRSQNFYIVTVPTPIDDNNSPDLRPLKSASKSVGKFLQKGDIVVYESTVYPGCTEEVCVPILESESGLKFNEDFFCGYSPERINPGDKDRRIHNIVKVTSGSNDETARRVDDFYKSIVTVGTHLASSIRVAEASKVIENTQRDVNIAFVNELAIVFDKMGLNTLEVLEAAGTKWNFLPFKPGLVGGHCIGVDPYYLTYKAESLGYIPEVILAGRRINDNMGKFIASDLVKLMSTHAVSIVNAKVLVMGITFKENCPDIRNSKVIDVVRELEDYNALVDVFDPMANAEEVKNEYNINLIPEVDTEYAAIVLAVAHDSFKNIDWESMRTKAKVIYDIKGFLPQTISDKQL